MASDAKALGPPVPNRPRSRKPPPTPKSPRGTFQTVCREGLPSCVQVVTPYSLEGAPTTFRSTDVLMLHMTENVEKVAATDENGKEYLLPLSGKQLYEVLQLDPEVDVKTYKGTAALIDANPLPTFVKVLEGYLGNTAEDTKEPDDVFYISRIEKDEPGQKVLYGACRGYPVRYRAMEDSAIYTTDTFSEPMQLSQIIDLGLPKRVRTLGRDGLRQHPELELNLRLDRVVDMTRVVATDTREERIITIPMETPLHVEKIRPSYGELMDLLRPIYRIVNTSVCDEDITEALLLDDMKASPLPLKAALESWLESSAGKATIAAVAESSENDLQNTLADMRQKLNEANQKLRSKTNDGPQKPPSRSKQTRPGKVARGSVGDDTSTDEEEARYDYVTMIEGGGAEETKALATAAETDLEKMLKLLLEQKTWELHKLEKQHTSLQDECRKLGTELTKGRRELASTRQELDEVTDELDLYSRPVMTPTSPATSKVTVDTVRRKLSPNPNQSGEAKGKTAFTFPEKRIIPPSPPEKSKTPSQPVANIVKKETESDKDEYELISVAEKQKGKGLYPVTRPVPPLPKPLSTDKPRVEARTLPGRGKKSSPASLFAPLLQSAKSRDQLASSPPFKSHSLYLAKSISSLTDEDEYLLPSRGNEAGPIPPELPRSPSTTPTRVALPKKDLGSFSKEEVSMLLRSLNMADCVDQFLDEHVDGSLLLGIDEDMMMVNLGMTSFQARKLTTKIDQMMSN
ncbi:uncharacterized protein [Diadema antillarum]|uniref:uncharacterized protein n=1 Tax=Diadema antillarum TaxID=105358 RepID=UPI003A8BB638